MLFPQLLILTFATTLSFFVSADLSYASDIISDHSTRTQVNRNGKVSEITGGRQAGNNLFHSFKNFSVPKNAEAFFNNNPSVANIFTRVTGGNLSKIEGLIRANNANLILINPNGIIFSQGAQLDLGRGSFVGTIGDSVIFKDGTTFSATESTTPLLTISTPIGIKINERPGAIKVKKTTLKVTFGESLALIGGNIELNNGTLKAPGGRIELGGLSESGIVQLGQDFSTIYPTEVLRSDVFMTNSFFVTTIGGRGGNINLNVRNLQLSGASKIETGIYTNEILPKTFKEFIINTPASNEGITIDAKNVSLSQASQIYSVNSSNLYGSPITVKSSEIHIEGLNSWIFSQSKGTGTGGNLMIESQRLIITDAGRIITFAENSGKGGDLFVKAKDFVELQGGVFNKNNPEPLGQNPSFIGALVLSNVSAKGGNVTLETAKLKMTDGSAIATLIFGEGQGGDLLIKVSDSVELRGGGPFNSKIENYGSGLYAQVEKGAAGTGGDITLETAKLVIADGAYISTSTFGKGDAGNLLITVSDFIELKGGVAFNLFTQPYNYGSGLYTQVFPEATGKGGNIIVNTAKLVIIDGAYITTSTFGKGDAGNVLIKAKDSFEITGTALGKQNQVYKSGLYADVDSNASGNGGVINIQTPKLTVNDGAIITTKSQGNGIAGNINIQASNIFINNFASISSESLNSNSGNIFLTAKNLLLLTSFSNISSNAGNSASGDAVKKTTISLTNNYNIKAGNIEITTSRVRLSENSDITTFASQSAGGGGNITINAGSILAFQDSDIFAYSVKGNGGNITLNTPAFFGEGYFGSSNSNSSITLEQLNKNNRVDLNATGALSAGAVSVPDVTNVQKGLDQLPQNLRKDTIYSV